MKKIIFVFAIAFAFNNLSLAAETGLEVMQQCAKAMKSEKRSEFNTIKLQMTTKQQGMSIGVTLYQKGTDKFRIEAKMPMGEQVIIRNGDLCAVISPMQQDISVEQWDQTYSQIASQDANPNGYLEEQNAEFELMGKEDFNGKSCQKVKFKSADPQEGVENTYIYVDVITKWLAGMQLELAEGQGKIEFLYSDMKKVKGVVYAGLIKTMYNGQEAGEASIDSFEVDIDLADSLFAKP